MHNTECSLITIPNKQPASYPHHIKLFSIHKLSMMLSIFRYLIEITKITHIFVRFLQMRKEKFPQIICAS